MKLIQKTVLILILAGSSAACTTTKYVSKPVELPLPDRPPIPTVSPEELECLTDEAYKKLADRERYIILHTRRLEAIIHANNQKAEQ